MGVDDSQNTVVTVVKGPRRIADAEVISSRHEGRGKKYTHKEDKESHDSLDIITTRGGLGYHNAMRCDARESQ